MTPAPPDRTAADRSPAGQPVPPRPFPRAGASTPPAAGAGEAPEPGRDTLPSRPGEGGAARAAPWRGMLAVTATARCGGCDWTAGPGEAAEADKAAEKHVKAGHPTSVVAEPAARAGWVA